MWVSKVVLVNSSGELRELELGRGLNLIVGEQLSGKTSIMRILEFLFGRRTCWVSRGPLRSAVDWYAMVLQIGGRFHLVARRAPDNSENTSSEAIYELLNDDATLENRRWSPNCTSDDLVTRLSNLVGIPPNQLLPKRGNQLSLSSANIKHALWLCLQHQNTLASQTHLFYRTDEDWPRRDLKAALPFFLGIQSEEDLMDERRLKQVKTSINQTEAEIRAIEEAAVRMRERADHLLEAAVSLGFTFPDDDADIRHMIAALAEWKPSAEAGVEKGFDPELHARVRRREEEVLGLRQRLAEIDEHLRPAEELADNAKEAARRSASIGLLETLDAGPCAVCGARPDEGVQHEWLALRNRLSDDEKSVSDSVRAMKSARQQIKEELLAAQRALERAYDVLREEQKGRADAVELRSFQMRQGTAIGRARELMRVFAAGDQTRALISKRERLQKLHAALVERLDEDEGVDAAASVVVRIGASVERWAPRVGLQDFANRVRLDLGRLWMVADTDDGPVSIQNLGGGINWEAYHVVSHLALHKELRARKRPVPSFLFLDQPSQVGLPQQTQPSQRLADLFELISEASVEISEDFQVIVTEMLGVEKIPGMPTPVHVLAGNMKLVPQAWIDEAS